MGWVRAPRCSDLELLGASMLAVNLFDFSAGLFEEIELPAEFIEFPRQRSRARRGIHHRPSRGRFKRGDRRFEFVLVVLAMRRRQLRHRDELTGQAAGLEPSLAAQRTRVGTLFDAGESVAHSAKHSGFRIMGAVPRARHVKINPGGQCGLGTRRAGHGARPCRGPTNDGGDRSNNYPQHEPSRIVWSSLHLGMGARRDQCGRGLLGSGSNGEDDPHHDEHADNRSSDLDLTPRPFPVNFTGGPVHEHLPGPTLIHHGQ